ncbi:hypothetical protein ACFY1L_32150 [Streptomyces sp. NPDC001663]|uniref:hypothetical protein n=1 Tax=Streptomyces sp. NPDC001663 TaxID=3364597 RepID=UPI0036C282CF
MDTRSSTSHSNKPSIAAAGDPLSALLHAAVADRPLEEVANLITLLEQSPQYAQATVDALRAVGTDRSVEDVSRLVTLLTKPPRDPASADEAIRAAAESRPVEDVSRLMALLHRPPVEPHCGQAAARAAATGRPVEELVELIGRLSEGRDTHAAVPLPQPLPAWRPHGEQHQTRDFVLPPPVPVAPPSIGVEGMARRPVPAPKRRTAQPTWPGLLAAAGLLLCAMLWFPLYRYDASLQSYGIALGASVLCAALAGLLTLRPVVPALVVAVVVPALLATAQLYEGRFQNPWLSRALDLTLAPGSVAGLAAVVAALVALTALIVRFASHAPAAKAASRPPRAPRPPRRLATASRRPD